MEANATPVRTMAGLLLWAWTLFASASIVQPDPDRESQSVAREMRYIAVTDELAPERALDRLREQGQPIRNRHPRFGFTDKTMWFLLEMRGPADQSQWFLELSLPFTDHITVFHYGASGQRLGRWTSGDRIARDQHPLRHVNNVFPLELTPGTTSTLVLRVRSDNIIDMPATLYTPEGFRQHQARSNLLFGLFFGTVVIMCLYNLAIFLSIRDRSYLFYVLYLASAGLLILERSGLALQWLWPEAPWWNHHLQPVLTLATMGLSILFANHFLGLRVNAPRWHRAFNRTGVALLILAPIALLHFTFFLKFASFLLFPVTAMIIAVAAWRSLQGFASARYFLLAYSAVALVSLLFWLRSVGVLASSGALEYSLQAAIALEALLLSFALAHRMTALKRENERIQSEANEELERRVHERTRELHQALNARSEFLATISHEVRTPLNGILGNIDLIRDKGLDDEQLRHLRVIEQSGYTLLQLINDVLDYAKIEAGRMELERHNFDLRGLINDCVQLFEHKARENRDKLIVDIDNHHDKTVVGDSLRIRQVLSNLISNAVKFTLDGEITVRVRHENDNHDYALFEVVDTGAGIDPERAHRLFEHFYQVDASTSRRHGGTGLGLAICRQLVELMGGEIGADSAPGHGSRFWFRIPLPPAEHGEEATDVEASAAYEAPPSRLLVVDDNHINLMVAQGLCRKLGHEVLIAQSGTEAIAVLLGTNEPPDLILMDCEMPDMDGFETTAEIRRLQSEGRIPRIPVVALTAHAVPEKIRACEQAGMISHIAKPVSRAKLGREIASALHSNDLEADNQSRFRTG